MSDPTPQNTRSVESILENLVVLMSQSVQLQNFSANWLTSLRELVFNFQATQLQQQHPNPLNRFGMKCFSQTDEDGITLEIIRRLGISKGIYAEFGVGNGLENNTLILAALGWRGFWVGGEDLAFNFKSSQSFSYIKSWITKENIVQSAKAGIAATQAHEIDIISIDLDGNDIYFVSELLENKIRPKLFIVEYNAQFIPPSRFQISYDPDHRWEGDNYFGAALSNFDSLFNQHGYRLICCNSHTGANAFFIDVAYSHLFSDVPTDIRDIYTPPRYQLHSNFGHRPSPKTVERIFADLNNF